jgi:hypothetical protein
VPGSCNAPESVHVPGSAATLQQDRVSKRSLA